TCNFTLDGIVNISNIAATNGTQVNRTVSGLGMGNHYWNVTCWDSMNNTNTSITNLFNRSGPNIDVILPTNSLHKVQNLSIPLSIAVSENVTLSYNFDGGQNYTLCTGCTSNRTNMSVNGFGSHYVTVIAVDVTGSINTTTRNFNLTLDSDGNGTADNLSIGDNDDDGDGTANVNDTMMGNATNVATNIVGFAIQVSSSLNLSINYNGTWSINISNGTAKFVTMSYNFTNSTPLILANLTVLMEDSSSTVGRTVVRNLPPSPGTYKTVYVNKKAKTQNWTCIKDSEPGLNYTLSANCTVAGEIRVPCNGTTVSGIYNCTEENGRLKVYGLSYSIAQSMCKENWTISSLWSECSSSVQTRTVTDSSDCGTTWEKPLASQSCTSATTTTTTTTTTSGGATSTTATDRVSYIVGNILAGEESTVYLSNIALGITEVVIKAKENAYAVKVVIERLTSLPSSVSAPSGEVYKYLNFANENLPDSSIESAKIKFKVDRSWMDTYKLKTGDVYLARYDGSSWADLKTAVIRSDAAEVVYEATTAGFSYFAIRATPLTPEQREAEAEKEAEAAAEAAAASNATTLADGEVSGQAKFSMPWKTIGIVALILVAVALLVGSIVYFVKSRREKSDLMRVKIKPRQ
ncbi:MAG: PGF-pre-PGF domain-containing protein, partial [Candidatus Woesearchaeota archaeon]